MPTYVHQKPCSRMFLSALFINNPRLVTCNSDERHQMEKKKNDCPLQDSIDPKFRKKANKIYDGVGQESGSF